MKVFLDDMRQAPEGWVQARWPGEVIFFMEYFDVEEISLDHDLACPFLLDGEYYNLVKEETGYDVLLWIEEEVYYNGFIPPKIKLHTANVVARKKMEASLEIIERYRKLNEKSSN